MAMRHVRLGRTGLAVSRFCLGTMTLVMNLAQRIVELGPRDVGPFSVCLISEIR